MIISDLRDHLTGVMFNILSTASQLLLECRQPDLRFIDDIAHPEKHSEGNDHNAGEHQDYKLVNTSDILEFLLVAIGEYKVGGTRQTRQRQAQGGCKGNSLRNGGI